MQLNKYFTKERTTELIKNNDEAAINILKTIPDFATEFFLEVSTKHEAIENGKVPNELEPHMHKLGLLYTLKIPENIQITNETVGEWYLESQYWKRNRHNYIHENGPEIPIELEKTKYFRQLRAITFPDCIPDKQTLRNEQLTIMDCGIFRIVFYKYLNDGHHKLFP